MTVISEYFCQLRQSSMEELCGNLVIKIIEIMEKIFNDKVKAALAIFKRLYEEAK